MQIKFQFKRSLPDYNGDFLEPNNSNQRTKRLKVSTENFVATKSVKQNILPADQNLAPADLRIAKIDFQSGDVM